MQANICHCQGLGCPPRWTKSPLLNRLSVGPVSRADAPDFTGSQDSVEFWTTVVLCRCKFISSVSFCGDNTHPFNCAEHTEDLHGRLPYLALILSVLPHSVISFAFSVNPFAYHFFLLAYVTYHLIYQTKDFFANPSGHAIYGVGLRLLGLWVRVRPEAWMCVCCECCV
jgi:hypothetical protein